jgi:hypothetical protein
LLTRNNNITLKTFLKDDEGKNCRASLEWLPRNCKG